jgi:NAD(P)-dependent dehydrogenase (short-subunit alcohol dehydrogenase family)
VLGHPEPGRPRRSPVLILDTNVVSTLRLVQQARRPSMGAHGGSVLIVASVAG